jgi:D-glycerate 3-kinase
VSDFSWPKDQLFLTKEQLENLFTRCHSSFSSTCQNMEVDANMSPLLSSLYIPLATWLDRRRANSEKALVVGLCGAQGSGKSTVTELLKTVLTVGFNLKVASFSIDDIYKTKEEREDLSRMIHPLLATRGVPGTHDVNLGIETIERLKAQGSRQSTQIPAFNKARDDRHPRSNWPVFSGRVDVIIFEGWCVGACPQSEKALVAPANRLEREEDSDGAWRRGVNQALAGDYQELFDLIDVLLMLKIDSMERVFEWRRLQEKKLAAKAAQSGIDMTELQIMSDLELARFIMHYERLTKHILDEMPRRADIVFFLDQSHNVGRLAINKPLP